MKAQKVHVCMTKMYAVKKCATSDVTKASTRTSKKRYQKDVEGKRGNYFSVEAEYIEYQINKIY